MQVAHVNYTDLATTPSSQETKLVEVTHIQCDNCATMFPTEMNYCPTCGEPKADIFTKEFIEDDSPINEDPIEFGDKIEDII